MAQLVPIVGEVEVFAPLKAVRMTSMSSARAQSSATWSSLSAAEWADREGNSALALVLEAAGVRRRCQPPPTPTPRKDHTKNRLLPRPRSRKGKHQLLDLVSLRPGATEGKNLRACPPLRLLERRSACFAMGAMRMYLWRSLERPSWRTSGDPGEARGDCAHEPHEPSLLHR